MADNFSFKDSAGATRTMRATDLAGILQHMTMLMNAAGTQLIGAQSSAGSLPVVLPSDMPLVGRGIITPVATFTRPADTTAYASGDLVANNVTAGSVVALTFSTAARFAAGGFKVSAVTLSKSTTSLTNASFRVHLFDAAPTCANGDNGAFSTTGAGSGSAPTWFGSIDVTVDQAFTDGAMGRAVAGPPPILIKKSSGQSVVALLEARAAYTPGNAEVFGLTLEVEQA